MYRFPLHTPHNIGLHDIYMHAINFQSGLHDVYTQAIVTFIDKFAGMLTLPWHWR